jgi:uncharacterized protein (DUF2384 family)
MPTIAFDIRNPESVAHELARANRELAKRENVPRGIIELVSDLSRQIADSSESDLAGIPPGEWMGVQSAALRAQDVLLHDEDERGRRQALRLAIEELRFRFARLAEHAEVADDRDVDDVLRWLDGVLSIPQSDKADLLAVSERKYQRWLSTTDPAKPTGDDDRRLRLVARLIAELRHVLTAIGAARWLRSPQPALSDRRPADVLEDVDPSGLHDLFGLVASIRSGAAA